MTRPELLAYGPVIRLWQAVVLQAVKDEKLPQYRAEVQLFLAGSGRAICELVDLSADIIRTGERRKRRRA